MTNNAKMFRRSLFLALLRFRNDVGGYPTIHKVLMNCAVKEINTFAGFIREYPSWGKADEIVTKAREIKKSHAPTNVDWSLFEHFEGLIVPYHKKGVVPPVELYGDLTTLITYLGLEESIRICIAEEIRDAGEPENMILPGWTHCDKCLALIYTLSNIPTESCDDVRKLKLMEIAVKGGVGGQESLFMMNAVSNELGEDAKELAAAYRLAAKTPTPDAVDGTPLIRFAARNDKIASLITYLSEQYLGDNVVHMAAEYLWTKIPEYVSFTAAERLVWEKAFKEAIANNIAAQRIEETEYFFRKPEISKMSNRSIVNASFTASNLNGSRLCNFLLNLAKSGVCDHEKVMYYADQYSIDVDALTVTFNNFYENASAADLEAYPAEGLREMFTLLSTTSGKVAAYNWLDVIHTYIGATPMECMSLLANEVTITLTDAQRWAAINAFASRGLMGLMGFKTYIENVCVCAEGGEERLARLCYESALGQYRGMLPETLIIVPGATSTTGVKPEQRFDQWLFWTMVTLRDAVHGNVALVRHFGPNVAELADHIADSSLRDSLHAFYSLTPVSQPAQVLSLDHRDMARQSPNLGFGVGEHFTFGD